MFGFFVLLFIFCHADVVVDWNVKQCSYSNDMPYKQCNDLLGCQCSHPYNETLNDGSCTQCIDSCTLFGTREECNANMHCEFNSQCERVDLFDSQMLRFYNIEITQENWDFINSEEQWASEPYVPCNLTVNYQQLNEKLFPFAMVKVKGSVGSKVVCQAPMSEGINHTGCRSLSYQINIDKNVPEDFDGEDPKVGGKDKIQFHAMNNDDSLMIERLSYSVMHHYLRITTSRSVHCVLFINGEKYGVFQNVEELDEKSIGPFLFGEKGDMYKDAWPSDGGVVDIGFNGFEDMDLMEELINGSLGCVSEDRLQMVCSPEEGKAMLSTYMNTDSYMKAMMANNLLNNFDGTPKSIHNHYWFQNKNNGPYHFVPWDYNNLIMSKFCKVNPDTGMIEGFSNSTVRYNSAAWGDFLGGICDAPPFQYLPSTPEERRLTCECIPAFAPGAAGFFNMHMACNSAFGIVASQSLADDYFNYRDDVFQGKVSDIKNEVKSWIEFWSNQILPHIDTSSLTFPPKDLWEKRIQEIPLFFDYELDQLMNRKKDLKREDIDAHFEWINNHSKVVGQCGGPAPCKVDSDCYYEGCEMEEMTWRGCDPKQGKCYVGSSTATECEGDKVYRQLEPIEDGWFCVEYMRMKECPPKKVLSCKTDSDCDFEGCDLEYDGYAVDMRTCSPNDKKCYVAFTQGEAMKDCEGTPENTLVELDDEWSCYGSMKFKACERMIPTEIPKEILTESPTSSSVEKEISDVSTDAPNEGSSEISTAKLPTTFVTAAILIILPFIL